MLSNGTLNLALNIWSKLTSGDFANFKEIETEDKNQYFNGDISFCKALLIENDRGSIELRHLRHKLHTNKQGFYAPCYIIANNGELFNIKQKQGFEPVISKVKDSLKADFCKAANLDEKLSELLTDTKPVPRLEFIKVSKGYNLDGLPHSCQSGNGRRFECLDNMAQMALLRIGSRIAARCIVWNSGEIFDDKDKGEYLNNRYADKLYYGDSGDRIAFINALEAEGIKLLWGDLNTRLTPETGDYCIKAPEGLRNMAWLDTFSLLKEGYLYSYDWSNGGYDDDTLNELASEYGYERAFLNVDTLGGTELEDRSGKVYSEYLGEYIDRENAVYSEALGDYLPDEDVVWSEFQDDYILADYAYYSSIEEDYVDERTYEHNVQIVSIINGGEEWVKADNPDYVPYRGNEFKRIALEDAAYIARDDEYIFVDDASYIDEIEEFANNEWSTKEFKDCLADLLEDLTSDELDALVEKYGF